MALRSVVFLRLQKWPEDDVDEGNEILADEDYADLHDYAAGKDIKNYFYVYKFGIFSSK